MMVRVTMAGAVLAAVSGAPTLAAQSGAGGASDPNHDGAVRLVATLAHPGKDRQFEEGYQKHLVWHAANHDTWAWYLWEVANGERGGLYIDGTFDHRWADFDAAVNPAGDGADYAANVAPAVTNPWTAAVRRLMPRGQATRSFERTIERSPLLLVVEYGLRPGTAGDIAAALTGRTVSGVDGATWLATVSGGDVGTLRLVVPLANFAALAPIAADPLRAALGGTSSDPLYRQLTNAMVSARSEVWRFRPDLSICRDAATRCHVTTPLPAGRP